MAGLKALPLAPPPLRLRVLVAVAGVPVVPTVTLTRGEDDLTGWETERRDELGPAAFEGAAFEELGKGTADPEAVDRAATISHNPFQLISPPRRKARHVKMKRYVPSTTFASASR